MRSCRQERPRRPPRALLWQAMSSSVGALDKIPDCVKIAWLPARRHDLDAPIVIPQRGFCRYHRGDSLTGFAMRRLPLVLAMFVAAMAPASAFENELLGKRDFNLPEYKSEQGALVIDEKGNITEFAIDFGSYKKQF